MTTDPDPLLFRADVARLIGVKPATLSGYNLPPADLVVSGRRVWRTSTIVTWNAARPGRGRWGKR